MKRFVILLLAICIPFFNIVAAEEKDPDLLPNIFIWEIPEDNSTQNTETTATKSDENTEEEITLDIQPEDVYVKGYAEYEESAETVYLKDENNNFVLDLRVPQKFESKRLADSKKVNKNRYFSRFNSEEYSIAPESYMAVEKKGGLTFGTRFSSEVSNAQLEKATSLFTRYEKDWFALSSAYKKQNLSTYGLNTDNFSFTPELKLNRIFTLSEVLSTDITRNRKAGELVLSINPTKDDRVRFELGAKTTHDMNSDRTWSQVRFSTNFKL